MKLRQAVSVALALALLVSGCRYIAGSSAEPLQSEAPASSATPSPPASASSHPAASIPVEASATPSPTPNETTAASPTPFCCRPSPIPVDDVAAANEFWESYVSLSPREVIDRYYDSLAELAAAAHLIIRGRISDVYIGGDWTFNKVEPAVPLIYASVTIDAVLKGQPVSRTPGVVEIEMTISAEPDALLSQPLPSDEYLWFLLYQPDHRADTGEPQLESELSQYTYFRPNRHQAVIRNANGVADVLQVDDVRVAYGPDSFPANAHGRSFAELVDEIEDGPGAPTATERPADVKVEESDLFWAEFSPLVCPLYTDHSSLAQAVAAASLIIRGYPVQVRDGHDRGWPTNITAIAISEVLKGEPVSRESGRIEIPSIDITEDLASLMPGGDHVLFLTDAADDEPVTESNRFLYYIDTWHQSVYRDIGGAVSIPNVDYISEMAPDSFSLNWHGRAFEDFVARVLELVSGATGSTVSPLPPIREGSPAC